ncbi:MAG: hypothetical protein ACREJ9_15670 [Candidatus Rokuibacteriota bacterium]
MSVHPLAGDFSVEASAAQIRHYRYTEERLMRTLGGWIALTPELPVKLLFGRHVWDCAQHADLWGRRLPELRAPANQSEPSNERFVKFMDLLDSCEAPDQSPERVVGVYHVLKPHLVATYEAHLAAANPIYEPPTRRILERCVTEERRHVAAGSIVLKRLLDDVARRQRVESWERRLLDALGDAGGVTGRSERPARSFDITGADPAGDLVALDSPFDPACVTPDLRTAIEDHVRALVAGDVAGASVHVPEGARDAVSRVVTQGGAVQTWAIVAQAKVGAHRFMKVRLTGPRGTWVVLEQWRQFEGQWRVVDAELIGAEPGP